ncbi:hypothetical protein BJ741DRAFT_297179 [Chytriomyces cf. hyalinus JEL632]|nr:hypothetical protein BJ741DRAFT_297179 [Chytriomyces cf. hyalinus JEL632]
MSTPLLPPSHIAGFAVFGVLASISIVLSVLISRSHAVQQSLKTPNYNSNFTGSDAERQLLNDSRRTSIASNTASDRFSVFQRSLTVWSRSKGSVITDTVPLIEPGTKATVIAGYMPVNPDELEIHVGDVIMVEKWFDDGWIMGHNARTGKQGLCPSNYLTA